MIHTVDGPKPIETFVGGELVLSRDEHTGEAGVRPIVATVATKDQPIYEVVIEDALGNTETLHTTAEHPFWVVARPEEAGEDASGIRESQWVRAASLTPGMRLVDMVGAELIVRSQSAAGWSADVFNVEVHEHHTYHVGLLRTWAHNAPCCNAGDGQKYRGVEIVDARGNPLGEFNHIEGNKFVEDKSARGLDIVNPKTGMPYQTADQWARHQIFDKTSTRIENLAIAADTRATREGTPNIPSLANIQGLTQLEFRVENATPAVKKAVAEQIKALQLKFPELTFTSKFGE